MIIVKLNTYKTMAIFNVNQNRQLFVVSEVTEGTPKKEGQVKVVKPSNEEEGKWVTFQLYGKGGLYRTDIIDLEKVCRVKITDANKMEETASIVKVTLNPDINEGKPVQGQDYVLRIQINNYLSPGDASQYIKVGAVHITKAMVDDPSKFYKKLAEILTKSFSREVQPLLTFKAGTNALFITEVMDQPWRLGVLSQDRVNFEVYASTITYDGDEVIWAETAEAGGLSPGKLPSIKPGDQTAVESGVIAGKRNNGHKIADLEYFCMAERGDMFRDLGCKATSIDVKMSVDPTKAYNVLDIHYHFSGNGVQVHKSEKDLTFVQTGGTDVLEAIKAAVMPED